MSSNIRAKINVNSSIGGSIKNDRSRAVQKRAKTVILGKNDLADSVFDLDVRKDLANHGEGAMLIFDENEGKFISTNVVANPNTKIICGKY